MVSGLDLGRRLLPAVGAVSVVALALTGIFVATPRTPPPVAHRRQRADPGRQDRSAARPCSPTPRASPSTRSPRTAPNKSVCYGDCATYWPPVPGNMSAGPGVTGKIGTITRTDGTTQATYDGHPLYTYIGDHVARPGRREQHQPERRALARRAGRERLTAGLGCAACPSPFPEPTTPANSRTEVFLRYLDFFRSRVTAKMLELPEAEQRRSRLPSGWTPLELVKHLRYVELRWLEWGFEGRTSATRGATGRPTAGRSGRTRPPPRCWPTCTPRPRGAGPSSRPTGSMRWASPVTAGTAPTRPPSSGSCSTCSRSTPGTSATWTSSPSSPPALGE